MVLVEVLVVLPPLVVDHVPPDAGHGRSTDEGSEQVDLDLKKIKSRLAGKSVFSGQVAQLPISDNT